MISNYLLESCPDDVVQFEAKKGIFVSGAIEPALENVDITITAQSADNTTITLTTDKAGKYRQVPTRLQVELKIQYNQLLKYIYLTAVEILSKTPRNSSTREFELLMFYVKFPLFL